MEAWRDCITFASLPICSRLSIRKNLLRQLKQRKGGIRLNLFFDNLYFQELFFVYLFFQLTYKN
jgi:hypothetical protein